MQLQDTNILQAPTPTPTPTPTVTLTEDGGASVDFSSSTPMLSAIETKPNEEINFVDRIKRFENEIFLSYKSESLLNGMGMLTELGNIVVEEFKQDLQSRQEWEENIAACLKLFAGFMEVKNDPWNDCSNVNLPLLTTAVIQFQARAFESLLPSKGVCQVVKVGGKDDQARGERVEKYMNYQLYYQMEDFEDGFDKTLMQVPLHGCVFRKTFYNAAKGYVDSQYVSAIDFVVNYGATTLEDAPRKTHILYLSKNDIRKRVRDGIFDIEAQNLSKTPSTYASIQSSIRDMADKTIGVSDTRNEYSTPRIFLEQHREWDVNGDGIAEPVIVTVDYDTEKVVRITDATYYDEITDKTFTIQYFTKYGMIPNPEGFYDFGFGTLIRGLNEAANTIVNEVIDAGSLANLQGGFITKRSGIRKGNMRFKRGEFQEVDTLLDDLNKAIFHFDFKGPNQTLYAVLGLLYEYSKLVSSLSETMTGQLPASDTPASTVLALIEEGRKVFSSIHKRLHRSLKKELQKIYRLNGIFLDDKVYFKVIEDKIPTNQMVQEQMPQTGRKDFVGNLDVIPVSDPTIESRAEKVMKNQQILTDVRQNPLTAQNQEAIYKATKRYYESLGVEDVEALLKPPPPPPDLPQEQENADMIMEKPATVLPQQDHLHHLDVLQELLIGVYAKELTPVAKRLVERHKLEHIAGHYLQQKQEKQVAIQQQMMEAQGMQSGMGGMGG